MSTIKDAAHRANAAIEAAPETAIRGRGTDALTDALDAATGALTDLARALAASGDLRLARIPGAYVLDAEAVLRDATACHRRITAGQRDPVAFDRVELDADETTAYIRRLEADVEGLRVETDDLGALLSKCQAGRDKYRKRLHELHELEAIG